ncbi:DSBA oxidoreductase [Nostocoides japonicum T1-X7]|uniref:DSBA oxidoreductase n=1 Tax=Nostocoides japonicum T1-X7 TaxID=1194083 RepID=A0A077LXS6_9MICO|nr:DsbA family oxidoreductase [Tetrasphaera japonica]CCH77682.1 DSBA oxidoreductase [Tetrasphaera japonica T1-X7]
MTTVSPEPAQDHHVVVDMWVDVVCPWCYIGKHRVHDAIAASEHPAEVTVVHHAYELDPEAPVGSGESVSASLAAKYGTDLAGVARMQARVVEAAQPDGIHLDLASQVRANTFDAHRLVALALAMGGPPLQGAMVERLFSAHFAEGLAVDDHPTLQRLAAEAGLDERRVASILASEEYADAVRADEDLARRIGVTGVPFTVAGPPEGRKVAVSGAQPVEVFGELLAAAQHPHD